MPAVPGARFEEQEAELGRAKAELHKLLVELGRISAERDALDRRVKEFSDWAYQVIARARERELTIAELQRRLAEAPRALGREQLVQFQRLFEQTATGAKAFQAQFERDLRQYRSQRAWKVMLFFRKAYTHLVREGWRGRLGFARWVLGLDGPAGGLEEHELQFPQVLSYLPRELYAPGPSGLLAEVPGAEAAPAPAAMPLASRPCPRGRHDVIVLPVFEYDFRFQRPQHLAEQFALQGYRVFWISPSRMLPRTHPEPYEAVNLRENLWEIHLRARQPNIYRGGLYPEDVKEYTECLRQLYREWAITAGCTVVQLPFWRRIALALREAFGTLVVYDCMDDWQTMPDLSEFARSEEMELARECDTLVVTSRELLEKCRARGREPQLVRNGVDFEFFSAARPMGRLAHLTRPVVGYFGAIAEWFDYDLLYEVARSRPQYSFVLIGGFGLEEELRGKHITRLKELPNLHALGHKPYAEIPSYLADFDVCIIPFVLNQVTNATDPVKLYEYLSQGKPVVVTAMGELAQHTDLIYIASGPGDFGRKLDAAVAERDPELKTRRIRFAAANTWRERFRAIETAVERAFPLVSIIIVTHQSAEYVQPCLDSLRRNTCYPAWEVIVVDNDSRDGTVELVAQQAALEPRIRVVRNASNAGFAAGNNLGVRHARGEYLVLLNMDTVVTPGWLERLMRHLRHDPSVGMVVPVTNSAGNEVMINVGYTNLQEMEDFALDLARDNMGIALEIRVGPLFCALVPRSVWEKVGELDERFEVGMFEDDDYSHRIARAGCRIVAAEDCFVHHFGQGAFSKLSPRQYQEVFDQNRRRFEEKWGFSWIPHQYRPGAHPAGARFTPAEFVGLETRQAGKP